MPVFVKQLLIVCPLVFLAGFLDSVSGGGGLISLPAYLMVGLPAHLAAGTNKAVASLGASVASVSYFRSGKVLLRIALPAAACSLCGGTLSTRLAASLPDSALKLLLLLALPCVAVFLALKRDFGKEESVPARTLSRRQELLRVCLIGLGMGFYDGMVGPGTGTFLLMLLTAALGIDLLTASGCGKVVNLASNLASAVVWSLDGSVLWRLVAPAALCNMLGNWCGARFAIRGGSRRVRGMIVVVLALLFVRVIYELLGQRG
jgi:uncharacterized membrane protein YfcA